MEKVGFNYRGRRFSLEVSRCNSIGKVIGLMFKRKKKAKALLFDFGGSTRISFHSFFVFFSFIAIWLDEGGEVIALRRVRPFDFNLSSKKSFSKVIEIPINKRYSKLIGSLVGDTKSL